MHFPQVAHQAPMVIEQPVPLAPVVPYVPQGPAAHWLSIVNPALTAGAAVSPAEINEALAMALAQNDVPAMRELVVNYGAPPLQLPPWFEHNVSPEDVQRQLAELAALGNDTTSPEMAAIARHLLANPLYAQASLARGPDGRTPLMAAASNPRSVEMLQAFLEVPGANPNQRTPTAENALSLTLLAHSAIVPNSLATMRAKMELLIDSGVKINTTAYAPGEMPVDDELAQHVVGNDIHPISLAVMKNMPNAVVLRLTQACLSADISPGLYSLFERAEFVAPGNAAPTEIRCAMEDLVRALTPPQFRWLMEHPAALAGDDVPFDMSCVLNACESDNFDKAALLLAGAMREDVPPEIFIGELHAHEQFFDDAIEVAQAAVDLALAHPGQWGEPMVRVLTMIMAASGLTVDPQAGTISQFTYAPAGYMIEALVASQQAQIQQAAGGAPGQLLEQTLRGMAVNQLVSAAAARIPEYLNELGVGQAGQPGTPEVPSEAISSGGHKLSFAARILDSSPKLTWVIAPARALCNSPERMKKRLLLPVLAGSLLLAGCGQKNETTAAAPASEVATVVEFTANDSMKFNLTRFEVKAGQDVTVSLTNMGNMPKAAMAHNWVLLQKGSDPKAFADAAVTAAATEYIPPALTGSIIAHTKLLGPKQTDEIKFKAPAEPGEYPFLCSFPAHYLSGMQGVMLVK